MSDPGGVIASPYAVVERSGDAAADRRRMVEAVRELGVERVVVGLPVGMQGGLGPAAEEALEEIEALAREMTVPVEAWDERLTTVTAERSLRAAGLGSRARRRVVDKVAAAVMLQSWLDSRPASGREAGRNMTGGSPHEGP